MPAPVGRTQESVTPRIVNASSDFLTALAASPRDGKTLVSKLAALESVIAGTLTGFATQLGRVYVGDKTVAAVDLKTALTSLVTAVSGKDDSLILPAMKIAHATVLVSFDKCAATL